MHHLGIPTTRSLTLCLTGESIERDIFYNGQIEQEPGAIVCRAAESFIRFGSFEIHAAHRETNQLQRLADFVIKEHYPHLWHGTATVDTYQQWFAELLQRTAYLVAHWQRVGFVHAVMNTDNMSIVGQTIDYGPYGWLEEYDPTWTPNFVDQQGRRYCYGNQPQIALWNLYRLANAILPLFNDDTKPLEEILETYNGLFDEYWNNFRANKLALNLTALSRKTPNYWIHCGHFWNKLLEFLFSARSPHVTKPQTRHTLPANWPMLRTINQSMSLPGNH